MSRKRMRRQRDNGFDEWGGYMEAKKTKLENQFNSEASNSGLQEDELFKGIAIFVNGYTVPSADELRYLMMKHGGIYHHYYRSNKTTHVIASNLPDSKIKQLKQGLLIVKPEWIVDSIKQQKVLDYRDYLLVTHQSKTQPTLSFKPSPTKTAKDETFLSEFYKNSRLHLISTMGATFKQYVNELRSKIKSFPKVELLMLKRKEGDQCPDWGETIMHIDMDCFFVSVGLRSRPELKGTPVAVTHAKGNRSAPREGVDRKAEYAAYFGKPSNDPNHWSNSETASMAEIASCSYEARQAGVKNGMFLGQALKLCPKLTPIPYDFEAYKEVSYILYDTVASYTLNIEAVSCDEMFVDCTELLSSVNMSPLEFASIIREEIKEKTGCPCSCGFGSNRLQSRLATRKAKPDGQFYLSPDLVEIFMMDIPVSDLPGVGRSTSIKLAGMGVKTCSDLQRVPLSQLQSEFGTKAGEILHLNSYGKDTKGLEFVKVRKSVSAEVNYGIRFENDGDRDKFLLQLAEEVSSRLNEVKMIGKSITLKLMVKSQNAPEETAKFLGHGICDHFTKSSLLKTSTDDPKIINREVQSLLKQLNNAPSKDLRGVGIQVSKLEQKSTKDIMQCFQKSKITPPAMAKELTQEKEKPSTSRTNDVSNNMKSEDHSQKKAPRSVESSSLNISISEIDPSYLDALPLDIRKEILDALSKTSKNPICHNSNLSPQKLSPTKPVITNRRQAVSKVRETSSQFTSEESLFSKVPPNQMRGLISHWLDSGQKPKPSDVDMFSTYLSSLVRTHQLDHLYLIIKTLHWFIKKKNKEHWKRTYSIVLQKVQDVMRDTYSGTLFIDELF